MPRAIWKGSISFGLVNAPVAMYAAIDEQDLHFHMIHTKDDSPIGDGSAAHVYALLSKAMEESGLAAICSYIFHSREQLGCLRVQDGVLFLEKMYFANEIRDSASAKPKR